MNAEQFISLADALRSYAQHSKADLNASNLFVHGVLMRAIRSDGFDPARITPRELIDQSKKLDYAA
jgi:hypothetical protein